MEQYDKALMESEISPSRLKKKRMKAFIEAASEVAPRELVEAVVDAHNALFEASFGRFSDGTRYATGLGATDPRKTNPWSERMVINGNDAVRNDFPIKPPTSANTDWHKQNGEGSAAYKHYENVVMNRRRNKFVPREEPVNVQLRGDDSWERMQANNAPVPQEPPPMEPPKAVRMNTPEPKVEPPKVDPPKVECPPACPAPTEPPAKAETPMNNTPKKEAAPEKKKATAAPYTWKETDFKPIENEKDPGNSCSTTHKFVINLVSFNKDNGAAAHKEARFLFNKGIAGVYTYQYDGLAQNTTRPDVWRVRIGYFKSKAAARTYFRKYIHQHVGDQFKWWVGTCDGSKGDNMKQGTFKLAKDISDNDCVDESVAKKPAEKPASNVTSQQPKEQPKENSLSALLR